MNKKLIFSLISIAILSSTKCVKSVTHHYYHDGGYGRAAVAGTTGFFTGVLLGSATSGSRQAANPVEIEEAREIREQRRIKRQQRKLITKQIDSVNRDIKKTKRSIKKIEKKIAKAEKKVDREAVSEFRNEIRLLQKALDDANERFDSLNEDLAAI